MYSNLVTFILILFNTLMSTEPTIRYSFLGVSKGGGAVIFGEEGKVIWKNSLPSIDGQVRQLIQHSEGNILRATIFPIS